MYIDGYLHGATIFQSNGELGAKGDSQQLAYTLHSARGWNGFSLDTLWEEILNMPPLEGVSVAGNPWSGCQLENDVQNIN